MNENKYQKIKVSHKAYLKLKSMAGNETYHGRGIVGVVDELVLGEFTTPGSGRIPKNSK